MYASSYARSSAMNSIAASGIWVIVSIVLAIPYISLFKKGK